MRFLGARETRQLREKLSHVLGRPPSVLLRYGLECAWFLSRVCSHLFSLGAECSAQADVVFLVDSSRYNTRESIRTIKRFTRDIVKRMAFRGGNFRVGVVAFGANAQTLLTFAEGDDKRAVKTVIGSIRLAADRETHTHKYMISNILIKDSLYIRGLGRERERI